MFIQFVDRIQDEYSLVLEEFYVLLQRYTFPKNLYKPMFQRVKLNFKMYFLGITFSDLNFLRLNSIALAFFSLGVK